MGQLEPSSRAFTIFLNCDAGKQQLAFQERDVGVIFPATLLTGSSPECLTSTNFKKKMEGSSDRPSGPACTREDIRP